MGNLLDSIRSPEDLRKLPEEKLPELAAELRAFIVESVSKTGGHLASSLGAVELAIAIHYVFDTPDDRLVWDVGHQAYAHKILTGRREAMKGLRQTGGISGFPRRSESPFDAFGTGHSSTSISAVLGMAVGSYLSGHRDRWHIAVIGDGALTGGMAVEALNDAGSWKDRIRLLVILNDNNYSISAPVGALSRNLTKLVSAPAFMGARERSKRLLSSVPHLWDLAKRMEKQAVNFFSPPSSLFSTFDLNYFGPVDGHDIGYLVRVLRNLKELRGPMVLHVVTKKGKGYPPAEADPTAYHGVGRFDPVHGIAKAPASGPSYSAVFGRWACDTARRDPRFYAITPAMREGSGLVEYASLYPERFRDVSIAEQHAVTYAAGLACEGMKPVVAIYSTFAQRAFDQIEHDVALQGLPVLFAVDRAGIVGPDGTTHHGFFDIPLFRTLPGVTIFTPSDENEARFALNTAYSLDSTTMVRYPRGKGLGVPVSAGFETIPVGKARTLREIQPGVPAGQRVIFLAFGSMAWRLQKAAEELGAGLVDMRFAKPLDEEAVLKAARSCDCLVTAEEGALEGGAGDGALELLASHGLSPRVLQLGIPDRWVPHGATEDLMRLCGLDTDSVVRRVRERLELP
ncbi:MAG: 1-deoxy-D-xylulose-5-phosphate synthase [Mesosutterella sp.]|nr:1-deoxy-D-xylulose-5-phosphate synthase [Mesosutterella sp.]